MSNLVLLPYSYWADPTMGRPLSGGKIFIGKPGLDPEMHPVDVFFVIDGCDDCEVAAPNPVTIGPGGVVVYNGSAVQIAVKSNYSMRVMSKGGEQSYFVPNSGYKDFDSNTFVIHATVGYDIGFYSSNPTFTDHDQFVKYVRDGKDEVWNLKSSTPTPYTVNSGATPDPLNDTNVTNESVKTDIGDLSGYSFTNIADMITGTTSGGGSISHVDGASYSTGLKSWIVSTVGGIDLGGGLFAQDIPTLLNEYGSKLDPAQLDKTVLLSETLLDENVVGKLQGFEYDEDNNRCFLVSYLDGPGSFPENEITTIAEYLTDDAGAITSLVARAFSVGTGHGEALLIDTSEVDKTYIWISNAGGLGGVGSSIRRYEWNAGIVGSAINYPHPNTLFAWADSQNSNVLMSVDGQNHYIAFSKFKIGDFTPYYVEARQPIDGAQVVSAGNQADKKRFGSRYGLSGFNMSSASSVDFWKNTSFLTADDVTLKLNYEQTNGGLSPVSEPESIGWKRKANGDIVTVIACKSPDAVRLFQCSGNAGQADVDNLNNGIFNKLRNYVSPISRNTQYTQSLNPFATMLIGIGAGATGGAVEDNYNDFYLTQKLQTAVINQHNQAEWKFHSKTDAVGDWVSPSVGISYEILFSADRGGLGKYPLQITKDNFFIGESSNALKDYATVVVKSTNNGASVWGFGGQVSFLGGDFATPGASVYIAGFDVGTKTRTRWNLFQVDRFRSNTDNTQRLGEAAVRWQEVFAVNPTINTSDEREKEFYDITEAEKLAAIEIKSSIRKFRWLDAIEKKGDSARIHCGVGAQTVKSILESHGLDPFSYSFLCYDEWEDILDDDSELTVKAGNRYGIRYEELAMFILSAI